MGNEPASGRGRSTDLMKSSPAAIDVYTGSERVAEDEQIAIDSDRDEDSTLLGMSMPDEQDDEYEMEHGDLSTVGPTQLPSPCRSAGSGGSQDWLHDKGSQPWSRDEEDASEVACY